MTSGAALMLALDTSTRTSIVVLGVDEPVAVSRRDVRYRHGSHLLEQIDESLKAAGATLADVASIAVGTGPGSFTGLRVGLAAAKTMAYARRLPLVGLMSTDALRWAAAMAGTPDALVVLPAGAHDHYLARPHEDPLLVAPGDLAAAVRDRPVIGVDLAPSVLGEEATRLGAVALDGMPAALLTLARERLELGSTDEVAELTPAYVALPRGVRRAAEELGWSPDLR